MSRKEQQIQCKQETLDTTTFQADPAGWFVQQPSVGPKAWLLAYADDGVIWGKLVDGRLRLSSDDFGDVFPPLRAMTLMEARLFGEQSEVRIWRCNEGFRACRLADVDAQETMAFDESYRLWGTDFVTAKNDFTLVADGEQGIRQALPLTVQKNVFHRGAPYRPMCLHTRRYLDYDEHGQVFVVASRLVALGNLSGKGEE